MTGEQDAIAEPTDAALFESALSDQDPEHQEGDKPQLRDEHGRFAAKAEAEAEEAAQAGQGQNDDRDEGQVPPWRLREIREERDAIKAERDRIAAEKAEYERELAVFRRQQRLQREAEQAPQRPDPIQDPDAYADWVEQSIGGEVKTAQQLVREQFVDLTFELAIDKHGKEAVDAAMKALEEARDPRVAAEVNAAKNPAKALMAWHKRHQAMTEVGDDLDGYIKRKQDEWVKDPEVRKRIMADLEAEARGTSGNPGNRSTVISLPPSLNRTTGGGGSRPGGLPASDGDFFNDAVSGLGRR